MTDTVTLSLLVGVIIAVACSLYAVLTMRSIQKKNNELFAHADGRDIQRILNECLAHVERVQSENKVLQSDVAGLKHSLRTRIIRPVMKRYNSFGDVGGNQSFSIALLDSDKTGVLISTLHSRDGAMMYAKWVDQGTPLHNLSKEEQEVLFETIRIAEESKTVPPHTS